MNVIEGENKHIEIRVVKDDDDDCEKDEDKNIITLSESLEYIKSHPRLQRVFLKRCDIDDDYLNELAKCLTDTDVFFVELQDNKITDPSCLFENQKLKWIMLSYNKISFIKNIDLVVNRIVQDDIEFLKLQHNPLCMNQVNSIVEAYKKNNICLYIVNELYIFKIDDEEEEKRKENKEFNHVDEKNVESGDLSRKRLRLF